MTVGENHFGAPRDRQPPDSPRDQYARDQIRLRKRSFNSQWVYFCQRSTFHGLADVYRAPNRALRVFWLTTFIGALGASAYGCYAILDQYLEAPVVASYFIQEAEPRFPLPDLIVCPFNRFSAEFLKEYNVPIEVAQYMQLTFGPTAKHPSQRRDLNNTVFNFTLMAELEMQTNVTLQRLNMTFGEFVDAASLKCEDLFIDCVKPTGKFACCDNATDVMTFAGKCYRIGGVDQLGPGYGYGMSVVVSLPKTLYSLALNNWLNDGVVLKLAERDQGVDYDLTFVPVGTHALMPLKATKYEFMNDPPRFECLEQASPNYSRVDCFDTCFMEAAQQACQCVIVTNMKKNNLPACSTYQFYFCIYRNLVEQFKKAKDTEDYFFRCRQRCTPRCTYHQYTSLISYSKFPSDEARNFTESEAEWTRMKNTIIIDIYYEKLEYTLIKHYRAMTIHGFIANLGGQYSLWLGGSILTLVQLIVFVVNYLFWRCCNGRTLIKTTTTPDDKELAISGDVAKTTTANDIDDEHGRRRRSSSCGENGHFNVYKNLFENEYRLAYGGGGGGCGGRRSISPSECRRARIHNENNDNHHSSNYFSRFHTPDSFHHSTTGKGGAPPTTAPVSNGGGMYICGEAIEDLSNGGPGHKSIFKRSITNNNPPSIPHENHNAMDKYSNHYESAF